MYDFKRTVIEHYTDKKVQRNLNSIKNLFYLVVY
jgi:hypothetical protein